MKNKIEIIKLETEEKRYDNSAYVIIAEDEENKKKYAFTSDWCGK